MTLSPLYGRAFLTNDLVVGGGSGASARRLSLAWSQVGGLGSFASLLDVKLDGLALLQGLQSAGLHRADVHEHILALLGTDEAVAPVGVEPLDRAICHDRLPPSRRQAPSMVRRRGGTPNAAPPSGGALFPSAGFAARSRHGWASAAAGPPAHRLRQVGQEPPWKGPATAASHTGNRGARQPRRRSGCSSGTSTRQMRTPSGSATHISNNPHGSRFGSRRIRTPRSPSSRRTAASSRTCSHNATPGAGGAAARLVSTSMAP